MKKRGFILVLAVIVVLGMFFYESGLVSAGLLDWFGKITGKATSQTTNVSITISGTNAVTIEVFNSTLTGGAVLPNTDTTKAISLVVRVTDVDGYLDINTTSVVANFTRTGEATRANSSCIDLSQNTTTAKNFSCTMTMWYYDESASWTITAAGKDIGNGTTIQNSTMVFTYGSLQDMLMSPNSITFASSAQGATNVTSNNDPSLINNTGNYNFSGINVTAYNLYGTTITSEYINVANITVGNNTGSNAECDTSPTIGANATVLTNGTQTNVKYSILSRGNHSIGDGSTGQEQVYYCFRTVPTGITSQPYSSGYIGGWLVSVNT